MAEEAKHLRRLRAFGDGMARQTTSVAHGRCAARQEGGPEGWFCVNYVVAYREATRLYCGGKGHPHDILPATV